jgi:hypothetical protein
MVFGLGSVPPYYPSMFSRIGAVGFTGLVAVLGMVPSALAEGSRFPGARPLGMGGAMRAAATGDAGPQLNPSGISLLRAFFLEGAYQYGRAAGSHDVRVSAVDSTSGFNIGGAIYYTYHRDSPTDGVIQTSHLAGISLSLPMLDKIFLGTNLKYLYFADISDTNHSKFDFDVGLTLRPVAQISIGAVGYNLLDSATSSAPKAAGGGVAVSPVVNLLFAFDTVLEKVYSDSSRDQALSYMGGGEFSFSAAAAIRAGGGYDGLAKNGYVTAGFSGISGDMGALDVSMRQDISGDRKSTILGISARIFVQDM